MGSIKPPHTRLFVSTALSIGGTVCQALEPFKVLTTVVDAGVSVLSGMVANEIPEYLQDVMVRSRDSQGQLQNRDLAEAVGYAISTIVKARAEAGTYPGSQKELVSLAKYTARQWQDIAQELETEENDKFAPIQDNRVPGLFSQALGGKPVSVLDKEDWLLLLQDVQERAKIKLPQNVLNELADNLRDNFIFALREVLKADFAGGAKAFADLVIAQLGSIHGLLARVPQGQIPEAEREQCDRVVEKLAQVQQELQQDREQFRQLGERIASGMEQILSEFEITPEQTDALVQDLRYWLRGEFEEVKDLVREVGLDSRGVEAEPAELQAFSEKVSGHQLTLTLVAGMLTDDENLEDEETLTLADLITDLNLVLNDPQIAGRHREEMVTLRLVLKRCFQGLSPVWQARLLWLVVLRRGFTRDLASAMVEAEVTGKELFSLVKRGFLVALEKEDNQPQRYEFLPLIVTYLLSRAGDLTVAHERAVEVYRSRCELLEDWTTATVEDVRDYLELFYHLCELGEYVQAFDVICNNPGNYQSSVSNFLDIRGYHSLLIELYLQVVQHLPDRQDSRYTNSLTRLGNAHYSLEEYQQAVDYHQQSLPIRREIGNCSDIASSLIGLGNGYYSLGEYREAISYWEESLEILREIGNERGEIACLRGISSSYFRLGNLQKAIQYSQQLSELQEIDDLPIPTWMKSIFRFAGKNKINLVLCCIAGAIAFPVILISYIAALLYHDIRRNIR